MQDQNKKVLRMVYPWYLHISYISTVLIYHVCNGTKGLNKKHNIFVNQTFMLAQSILQAICKIFKTRILNLNILASVAKKEFYVGITIYMQKNKRNVCDTKVFIVRNIHQYAQNDQTRLKAFGNSPSLSNAQLSHCTLRGNVMGQNLCCAIVSHPAAMQTDVAFLAQT